MADSFGQTLKKRKINDGPEHPASIRRRLSALFTII
jgi:hypothetical protein